jgi:predicted Zn-dependent protease
MADKEQNFWLVRDLSNVIRGPYKHQEVLNLLRKKQLKNKTEISRANSYWFAVEEKSELARFFPELGLAAPPEEEKQTQMTATLTQADLSDREDVTTFVATPKAEQSASEEAVETSNTTRGEWLSQEMADEFGDFDDFAIETPTQSKEMEKPEEPLPIEESPAEIVERNTEEMMKRATVKADTLPSELKSFQGSRPKPISNLMRGPERSSHAASTIVQVPVEKAEGPANILSIEIEEAAAAKRKKHLVGTVFLIVAMAVIGLGYSWISRRHGAPAKSTLNKAAGRKQFASAEEGVRRSLVLYDLEGAKEALSDLELAPESKGDYRVPVAQALVKKEFLFDSEGALSNLLLARSLAGNNKAKGEVTNLIALYGYDRDPERSIEALRGLVQASSQEPIYRYNLAVALLRNSKAAEALTVISPLVAQLSETDSLFSDAAFTLGWAQELDSKSRELSEGSFLRSLGADPTSSKARLGLAIHRLRKSGFGSSQADFRAFIDLAPDLDPPSRIINFRKMESAEFYNSARGWIRELNLDGPMGSKPAPLIMAVDAMLSCLQNRTGEAGKILEGALSASNSDFSVLKVMGYHRWKESRYAEIVELLKDVPREKMGFFVPFIMGKALIKLDRRGQAEKFFEIITQTLPARSEGWALLGDSYLSSGKKAEAQLRLTNAIHRDPQNLVAMRALDRLGQQNIFSDESMGNLPF